MGRASIKTLPSQEELASLLDYNQTTGVLRWKYVRPKANRIKSGDPAGTVTARGYLHIGIARRYYLAHRVIWKLMTGQDPIDQIDHIDGDRLNNRWVNIRAATNGSNRWNSKLPKNNKSGVKGVCRENGRGWVAYINRQRIGRFDTKADAMIARQGAAKLMHGEFLRLV
jgi:hypothetical protein